MVIELPCHMYEANIDVDSTLTHDAMLVELANFAKLFLRLKPIWSQPFCFVRIDIFRLVMNLQEYITDM